MMTSPLGVNNLNQLVEQQLGNTGYEVVRTIYNNIQWLHSVYTELPKLGSVQQALPYVDLLAKNANSVEKLVAHLHTIENLNSNLPLVQDLAPRIQSFKNSLDSYQVALTENSDKVEKLQYLYDTADMHLRELAYNSRKAFERLLAETKAEVLTDVQEALCDMKEFHKTVKEQYSKLEANNDILTKYLSTASENHKMLKHLMASDAVNTYLWEQTEAYKQEAMNAIKASEKAGNSEVTNRHKMKATKSNLNLFKVLNRNNLELANRNVAGQVQQTQEMCNG